jgi:long-chain acyl-CoA synthetase
MLFERWREIAGKLSGQTALRNLADGAHWTFAELFREAERQTNIRGGVSFVQATGPEFVFQILSAWKQRAVVCPLEPGQTQPQVKPGLPEAIAHLKTTSATTGPPHLVAFTPEQLAADAENIVTTMGLRQDWANVGVISLAHSYGFSNLILPLLLHGIPLVLVESALPEALRRVGALPEEVTLPAVPALWRAWSEANAIPSNVRLAISAGAPLPLVLEEKIFSGSGLKVHNFYGSSECGGIAYDSSSSPRLDPACIGEPMKNVQVSIAEDGCLEVRGLAVGQTFWPEPKQNLKDGVFHSSDLAEVREGKVFFNGRACDRINVAGRKVSPETIERALASHPKIRECLVFGVPSSDAGRGENIVACVGGATGSDLDSLKQHLMARLPAWQVPRDWWLIESLEASKRGKLSRTEWRKLYLEKVGAVR